MSDIIYRCRRYSYHDGWKAWYEPCPVLKRSPKFVVIESQDFPESPLYRGGRFSLSRQSLEANGKAYHSRHGEWFFLEPQRDAFLFPSKDILETKDFTTLEAERIGWDCALGNWEEWQVRCWLCAKSLNIPLREAIDRWRLGGNAGIAAMEREIRQLPGLHNIQWRLQ